MEAQVRAVTLEMCILAVYANDMLLLSSTVNMLQKMLIVCADCGKDWNITFSAQKPCLFEMGPAYKDHTENLTRSSAVAERPRELRVIKYFALSHSRSFKMTLFSRACVSPY